MSYRRRLMMGRRKGFDYSDAFKTVAVEDAVFTFTIPANRDTIDVEYISYSIDDGKTWVKTANVNSTSIVITTPLIEAGGEVTWKGMGYRLSVRNGSDRCSLTSSGSYMIKGNILSLLYDKQYKGVTQMKIRYASNHDGNTGIFSYLFDGQTNLVDCSELILPITSLRQYYYHRMFRNCTNITNASFELPAKSVLNYSYAEMFYGCTNLSTPPIIEATSSAQYGMNNMFYACNSLVVAPDLHCKSLNSYSYGAMFQNCINLTTIPYIEDASFSTAAFHFFTLGCKKLNYVKMLCKTVSSSSYLNRWMDGVPNVNTSVFVKHIDATWTYTGNSGVPNKWKIIYYDPELDKYYLDQNRNTECDDHGNTL